MFAGAGRFFSAILRRRPKRRKLLVYLDEESFERFERLSQKLRTLNDSQLIGLSLKALESKTDKIIMMHITKRAPELKKEGMSDEAIAEYFNRQDIPVPAGKDRWDGAMISSLINEKEKDVSPN